jgi:hypothetical protein
MKSNSMPSTLHFYVFGWDTKAGVLRAQTIHVSKNEFQLIKIDNPGFVLNYLVKQD